MKPENNLNNKYRVLLTEVLPYELPIVLNNEAFYQNMQDDELRTWFLDAFNGIVKKDDWTIPFDYDIVRVGGEKSRKLSIMHPLTQLECVEFYNKYDGYMLHLCSSSPSSIRYINKKAKCVFAPKDERTEGTSNDELERPIEIGGDDVDSRYRSYFSYKKYDLSYKFFESDDNLRLEQKYPYMMTIDISSCFYHIYTHSITWAVKGKDIAKTNRKKKTFENEFDKLMQHTNYNETNGIIVGPEISRIFAEIILQTIDLAIIRQLKERFNYSLGRDYEIRRYVDDSYVYSAKRETLEIICSVYQEQLAIYKLDINKSKLETFTRPFTSSMSDAKLQINSSIRDFKDKYLAVDDEGRYNKTFANDMSVFSSFVKQLRSITHQFQQNYGLLNKYTLTLLLRQIRSEMNKKRVPSQGLLTAYAEIAFYVFSLDMHATASYRLCSIIDRLVVWADNNPDMMVMHELLNRMRREAKRVLDIYQSNRKKANTNLEVMNLLISLNRLMDYKGTIGQLENLFGVSVDDRQGFDRLNYFQICTLLYVIGNDAEYKSVKEGIEEEVIIRLSDPVALRKSDHAHLFFDLMTCPFVSQDTKLSIVQKLFNITNPNKARIRISQYAKPKRWFLDWDKTHPLAFFLNKKEYHSPYE